MRDNSDGMPELVATYERDGNYFATVSIMIEGERATFEFGVEPTSHKALKRIFESHPLPEMPGVPYRYFFGGDFGRKRIGHDPVTFSVRMEAGRSVGKLRFDGPTSLVANLLWFRGLKKLEEASALRRIA